MKVLLIKYLISFVMWLTAMGVGIWYVSSSLGGSTLSYTSLDGFMGAIGTTGGDIATANGCWLCGHIQKLFMTIGDATQYFWDGILSFIWILIAAGFALFLFIETYKYLQKAASATTQMNQEAKIFQFKPWFDSIKMTLIRVLVVGAFLGGISWGGSEALKWAANISIAPVMYVGTELSMAATGIDNVAQCPMVETMNIMGPVIRPFMCVMGNLNTVMLAGAASGFTLMNYAWMGLGGGLFTWLAGLVVVILFLYIGFGILFDVLTTIFQLVFLIIFLPLIIGAAAFEKTWKLMEGVLSNAVGMLAKCAVRIVAITLKVLIVYWAVVFAAEENGFKNVVVLNDNSRPAIMDISSKCERTALVDGEVDKDKFKECWFAEQSKNPSDFNWASDPWSFLLLLIGIFLVYQYAVKGKIDKLLGGESKDPFEYGKYVKNLGKGIWDIPKKIGKAITDVYKK